MRLRRCCRAPAELLANFLEALQSAKIASGQRKKEKTKTEKEIRMGSGGLRVARGGCGDNLAARPGSSEAPGSKALPQ